jgi:RND family efflux transporter MFP subunit
MPFGGFAGMVTAKGFIYVCFALCLAEGIESGHSNEGVRAVTRPSADVTLSFVQPGRIAKVLFKEGDAVKVGQILIQQDDSVERARLAQAEAQSQDTTQIRASEASLAQKRVDLKKLETAAARNAATELEVEHARLDAKIAELSLELAKFEHEQARRKYEEEKARVDNMRLISPIDGTIEKINVEVGESVNALDNAMQVVQIDPLWIDVPVPLARATTVKCGGTAKVNFPGPQSASIEGKIIFVGAVADAASGTLRVRVEVPNKSRRLAGEHVEVVF